MSVLSFIYRQWLNNCESDSVFIRSYSFAFKSLRRLILSVGDPVIQMKVRKETLWMPFSHMLPYYAQVDPQYDTLLGRLAAFIRAGRTPVCGIDVGANIGDTVLACEPTDKDKFLALEPHREYFACLERNLGRFPNVRRLNFACGKKDIAASGFNVVATRGTAQIQQAGDSATSVAFASLDTLLESHPDFSDCNFLKIDTDGHDFEVISGARNLIERAKPAVLFECDLFQNTNFVEDVANVFNFFAQAGYQDALIYDNFGFLLCRLDPKQPEGFAFALFHKLISQKYYFDVLMLPEGSAFLNREIDYFVGQVTGDIGQIAAKKAAESIRAAAPAQPA